MAVIALLGSGEFLPWAREVDEWCAARSTAASERALVVPTASAPDGEETFQRWAMLGTEHYHALGLAPQVLELRTRDDAQRPEIVDAVDGARIIFFSGGNPGYLAETVAGTPFWEAVLAALGDGTALGGCSAGAMFLGVRAPFVTGEQLERWVDGMNVLTRASVLAHFDALDSYQEGLRDALLAETPPDAIAVGIDEETALYGDGETWTVAGAGSAWISTAPGPQADLKGFPAGEHLSASLGVAV